MAKKKKKDVLTLIQCSFGAKERIKAQAKKEGVFLNRLMDRIIHDYCNVKELFELNEHKPKSKKGDTY